MNQKHLIKLQSQETRILEFVSSFCDNHHLRYFLIGGTLLGAVRHKGFIPWDDDIDIAMPREDFEKFQELFRDTEEYELDSYKTNQGYWLPFIKIRAKGTEYIESVQRSYTGPTGIWLDIFPLDKGSQSRILDRTRFAVATWTRRALYVKAGFSYQPKRVSRKILITALAKLPKKLLVNVQRVFMLVGGSKKSGYIINIGSQYGFDKQRHPVTWYEPSSKLPFCNGAYSVPGQYGQVLAQIYGKDYMKLPPKEKRITHNPIKIKFKDGEEVSFLDKES